MNEGPGFGGVLGQLLPVALATAFGWVPISVVITLLLAPGHRRTAPAFLVGWLTALVLVTTAFVAGARALPEPHLDGSLDGSLVAGVELAAGLALVVVGFVSWRSRAEDHHHFTPRWLRRLGDTSPVAVLVTGLLLGLGPKSLVLGLTVGIVVRSSSLPVVEAVVVTGVYVVLAGSSVALPVVSMLVTPHRTERWLQHVQRWLGRHGSLVAAVVAALVGVVLVVDAVRRF